MAHYPQAGLFERLEDGAFRARNAVVTGEVTLAEDVGIWFSGRRGVFVALLSTAFAADIVAAMLWFTVQYGWLRSWEATARVPQIVITLFNPGTLITLFFAVWSVVVLKATKSTRMGAVALFTCFLVGFTILTYFATVHRGPNWDFFWSASDWPVH